MVLPWAELCNAFGVQARELGFSPRDAGDTLNDTVRYLRENFRVGK
ncbi:MAG TPA: hypothetical protein VN696_11370 [Pyrinomonadaceae bacterium]|nr:hypothetical protein [Pyrinomonadaceae bacterium]